MGILSKSCNKSWSTRLAENTETLGALDGLKPAQFQQMSADDQKGLLEDLASKASIVLRKEFLLFPIILTELFHAGGKEHFDYFVNDCLGQDKFSQGCESISAHLHFSVSSDRMVHFYHLLFAKRSELLQLQEKQGDAFQFNDLTLDLGLNVENAITFLNPDLKWSGKQQRELLWFLKVVSRGSRIVTLLSSVRFHDHREIMFYSVMQSGNGELITELQRDPENKSVPIKVYGLKDKDLVKNPLYHRMRLLLERYEIKCENDRP